MLRSNGADEGTAEESGDGEQTGWEMEEGEEEEEDEAEKKETLDKMMCDIVDAMNWFVGRCYRYFKFMDAMDGFVGGHLVIVLFCGGDELICRLAFWVLSNCGCVNWYVCCRLLVLLIYGRDWLICGCDCVA